MNAIFVQLLYTNFDTHSLGSSQSNNHIHITTGFAVYTDFIPHAFDVFLKVV